MKDRITRLAALLVAATLGLYACSDTNLPEATGKGTVRGINAVVGLADVTFLIEEFSLGSLAYKTSTASAPYDDLSYIFNFDLPVPNESARRIVSRSLDLVADTDYTFVLAGTVGAEQVFLWERPEREWSGDETVFEVSVGHANPSAGAVDVYLLPDGTAPVAGNQVGTLSFGENLDVREFDAGDYDVVLTAVGDPATIVYQGRTATIAAADTYNLVVFDTDPGITAPVSVRLFNSAGNSIEIQDERFPATVQFINTSLAAGTIDVIIDGDFTSPAVSGLAPGGVSADVEVPTTGTYQYVATGTTTAILEQETSVVIGTRSVLLLTGDAAAPGTLQLSALRRGFSTAARLRLINAITDPDQVNFYFLTPGNEVTEDTVPSAGGVGLQFNSAISRVPGDIEITVTATETGATLVDSVPVTLAANSVVDIIALDTADPNVKELLLLTY